MKKLKLAIVHDYIKEYGGAERVLETLHNMWPDAPVYTTVFLPEFLGPHKKRFQNWNIITSWLQYVPFNYKLISLFRLISPWIFANFDFSEFDVVIVSQTGAYFPNCIQCHPEGAERLKDPQQGSNKVGILRSPKTAQNDKRRNTVHICYCHTPPRYLYGYMTARAWKKNIIIRILGEIANHFLRMIDFQASRNVDYFIANSVEVQKRIRKFYKRDSIVINPPAIPASSKLASSVQLKIRKKLNANYLNARSYYLTGGRLARAKGTDIIIEAFAQLDKPLKVFGRGFAGFEEELKKISNGKYPSPSSSPLRGEGRGEGETGISNIQYLGEVAEEEKFELMKNAKAFIFSSFDEDFGITPVEAMSMGTPVIAYKSGGVKETVIEGKTGLFYEPNTPEALIKAVRKFEKMKFDPKACIIQARKFSKESFEKQIKKMVNSKK